MNSQPDTHRFLHVFRRAGLTLAVLAGFVASPLSQAKEHPVLELHVMENIPVYQEPSTESTVISRLDRGDKVVTSPKLYGQFRKVLITFKGKPTAGYIPIKSLQRSEIKERDAGEFEGRKLYKSNYTVGLALIASYMRQGANSFTLSDGSSYDTTAFTSSTTFFSIFTDVPIDSHWSVRGYVSFRQTQFQGVATQRDTISPTPLSPKVSREQTLLGLGGVAKYYPSMQGYFWYGGGGELARGNSVSLKLNGITAPTTASDLPFYVMLYGATGIDVPAPMGLYFVPDARLGLVATTKPITIVVEAFFGVGYLF